MKRLIATAALVGAAVLFMAARPGNEFTLIQQLNGQPVRPTMPDGGAWGVFKTFDAGQANNTGCAPLTGLTNNVGGAISANVLVFSPLQPLNVCVVPSINNPAWDGGCWVSPGDINYGWPAAVGVPQYVTPDSAARQICFVGDAGSLAVPLWWAQ